MQHKQLGILYTAALVVNDLQHFNSMATLTALTCIYYVYIILSAEYVRPTQIPWLLVLANITPLRLRQKVAIDNQLDIAEIHPEWPLHVDIINHPATPILCSAFTNERRHDRKATKLTAFFANRPSQDLDARHHTLHEQCGWIKVNPITRRLLGTAAALQQSLTRVVHQFHKVLHVLCELAR